ncbi:MAG: response regulator [Fidelibacterota bacterium]
MPPKIVIVDDDRQICELFSEFFQQNGFTVYTAFSAADALKIIRERDPDIVLSDIIMPGEDGFSLYEKVQLFNPDLPFVFITGYEHDKKILARLKETGRKWIAKPVTLEELMSLVNSELK